MLQQVIVGVDTMEMISEMDLSSPSEIDFEIEEFDDQDGSDVENNDEDEDEDGDDDYDSVGFIFQCAPNMLSQFLMPTTIINTISLVCRNGLQFFRMRSKMMLRKHLKAGQNWTICILILIQCILPESWQR